MTFISKKPLSSALNLTLLLVMTLAVGLALVLVSQAVDLVEVFETIHGGAH